METTLLQRVVPGPPRPAQAGQVVAVMKGNIPRGKVLAGPELIALTDGGLGVLDAFQIGRSLMTTLSLECQQITPMLQSRLLLRI